jgi:ABC-type transporter Mla subunit MlaD
MQFTKLLTDLSNFGKVATHIITASRQQTVAGLRDLQPILGHLRAAGSNLPRSLELLITYPFPKNVDKAIPGDYNGLYLSFNADPIFCTMVPPPIPLSCSGSAAAGSTPGSTNGTGKGKGQGLVGGITGKLPHLPVPLPTPSQLLGHLLGNGLTGGGL